MTERLRVDALIERAADMGVDRALRFRAGCECEFDQSFRLVVDGAGLRAGFSQLAVLRPDVWILLGELAEQ